MDILTIDFCSPKAPKQLAESIHHTGFAVLKNHPLSWKNIETCYQEWSAFFNSEAKYNYHFNPETQDGYLSKTHEHQAANSKLGIKDIKEVFQLYIPHGQYPKELSDLPRQLFHEKFKLGKTLLAWLEAFLPDEVKAQEKLHLSDMLSMERTLYRAIHYPPLRLDEEPGAVRAAAHEDFSLLTLLPAATEAGLQVRDNEGTWHEVEVDPKTIVINAGGTLQQASNYYFRSTLHQVVNPNADAASRPRFSLPMFLHGHRDAYLSERYASVGLYFDEEIKKLDLHHPQAY